MSGLLIELAGGELDGLRLTFPAALLARQGFDGPPPEVRLGVADDGSPPSIRATLVYHPCGRRTADGVAVYRLEATIPGDFP